jgi:hypothetical protein
MSTNNDQDAIMDLSSGNTWYQDHRHNSEALQHTDRLQHPYNDTRSQLPHCTAYHPFLTTAIS